MSRDCQLTEIIMKRTRAGTDWKEQGEDMDDQHQEGDRWHHYRAYKH